MRPVLFLFTLLIFAINVVSGQEKQETDSLYNAPAEGRSLGIDTSELYRVVPLMPQFPGGEAKMFKYFVENLDFPMLDSSEVILGRIIIQFVIDEDGKVRHAKVNSKVAPEIARVFLEVINALPLWTPGEKDGNRVRVQYVLPMHICYN